jgi:hypothetical protein
LSIPACRSWTREEVRRVAIHPDDLDRIERRIEASFASGEPFEEEMRMRRTDGEYRWFLTRAVPLRDKRGKVLKWHGAATDIQDRKRAEELQADLAHTNRVSMLGELAASISHELKQPISAAVMDAQASLRWLNRDQPDLGQARRATAAIVKDGRLAVDIIDRLRSLYKKTPPQRESVDVGEVIGEMVLLLRSEANEHAVSIRTDLAADLPKITADRVQLQQVLMNLISQRHRSRIAGRKSGRDLQCLLHDETSRQWHGAGDQPFHRGIAWWPFVGHIPRRTRRDVSFHSANCSRESVCSNITPSSYARATAFLGHCAGCNGMLPLSATLAAADRMKSCRPVQPNLAT